MSVYELALMGFLDGIQFNLLMKKIMDDKSVARTKFYIGIIAVVILATANNILFEGIGLIAVNSFSLYLIAKVLYQNSWSKTLFLFMIVYVIMLSLQLLTVLPIGMVLNIQENYFTAGLISHSITIPLVILIYLFVPIDVLMEYIDTNNHAFKIITMNIFFIGFSVVMIWRLRADYFVVNIILFGCVCLFLMYINLVQIKKGLINKKAQEQLKVYETCLPVIENLISELRIKQHDYDNHIQSLEMALAFDDIKEIREKLGHYIHELKSDNELGKLIKLNNSMLAALMYSKLIKAKELNIGYKINIQTTDMTVKMKDYELVEMVGILLDNAIESQSGIKKKWIEISLKNEDGMKIIEIKNRYPYLDFNATNKFFKKGYSTKDSNKNTPRGYGLYTVKKLIGQYDNHLIFYNETLKDDNYVVFKVMLK